jgi:uncharacterized protein YjbJ (UPF0337 family)
MAGTMDKLKGSVKDAVGSATGNTRLRAEGKTDKAKGHAEDMADRVAKVRIRLVRLRRASKTA